MVTTPISLGSLLWILNLEAMTLEVTSASCHDWSSVFADLCETTPNGREGEEAGWEYLAVSVVSHLDP